VGTSSQDFLGAEDLDRLVQTNPSVALAKAAEWARSSSGDPAAECEATSIVARAYFELGQLDRAAAEIRSALALARRSGAGQLELRVAMSASAILADAGHLDEALAMLDAVEHHPDLHSPGRVATQRAYVLHQSGELASALEHADRAEPLLRASNDDLGWLRLLVLRGLIRLQQGRFREAEDDFLAADDLAAALDQVAMRAGIAANLGVLYGRSRRILDALAQFDAANELHREAGEPGRMVAVTNIDRAEVLMHAGLVVESVEAAAEAVQLVVSSGNRVVLGDALLLLARAQLAAGSARSAQRTAAGALDLLESSGRAQMVAHARAVAMHAVLSSVGDVTAVREALSDAGRLAEELNATGWQQLAGELRLSRMRAGYRHGLVTEIATDVDDLRLGAFSAQRDTALAGWYAEAIAHSVDGDRGRALSACRSGLELLDDIVAEAPTLEQRSAAMRLGNDLSQLTIEIAIELDDADSVLAAAEGTRARALHEELAEQRRHRPLTESGAAQLRRELSVRLGDRTLVEWVVARDTVWAVVFDAAGSRLIEVGCARAITRARDRVLVWLDLAATEPDASSVRAMRAATLLDDLLIAPLELRADSGVLLVPVDLLHGIPWSGLPSFAGRPISLAPNAQMWLEADRRASGTVRSVGLAVGPDVDNAEIERSAVERTYPRAAVAGGAGSTAATVRLMFAGLDLVHLAAHGRFRSDHPLLSTVRLSDGDATLYDVVPERVRSRLVVLSSCEGGAQGTADGSEVLGLSAVMLARGAAAVLAPLTVVRDLECADFVAEVHAALNDEPFACAVAAVRQRWLDDDDLSRWAVASSFTCFGSGAVTVAAG
jgi:CHAT domain-containing protein/predicted negative regulator of RcsB-dependent stress response